MHKIYLKQNEITFLKSVCGLIDENVLLENKRNVSAFQISQNSGISYNTVRKIIKKIKDL